MSPTGYFVILFCLMLGDFAGQRESAATQWAITCIPQATWITDISFLKNWKNRPYVWKCAFINISLFCLVALELWDFPPIWGTLDAHAIWHLTTIPFCYFWYSFLLDDARHDEKSSKVL